MAIFQELNLHGITVVIVTHEPDIAAFCTRVVRFRDGRMIEDRRNEMPHVAARVLAEMPPVDDDADSAPATSPQPVHAPTLVEAIR
jgi:putative ABC transport system ATP-binding protein